MTEINFHSFGNFEWKLHFKRPGSVCSRQAVIAAGQAERLLRDSAHRRIANIVYAVGFQDLSYFNRAFRQRTGETPSAARRRG